MKSLAFHNNKKNGSEEYNIFERMFNLELKFGTIKLKKIFADL